MTVFSTTITHPTDSTTNPLEDVTRGYYSSINEKEVSPLAVHYEECRWVWKNNKVTADNYYQYLSTFLFECLDQSMKVKKYLWSP
jgi:hypothetical protein